MRRGWDALKWLHLFPSPHLSFALIFLSLHSHSLTHKTNQSVRWNKTGMNSSQNSFNDKEQVSSYVYVIRYSKYDVMSFHVDGTLFSALKGCGQRCFWWWSFSYHKSCHTKNHKQGSTTDVSHNNKSPSVIDRVQLLNNCYYLEQRKINRDFFAENAPTLRPSKM